VRAGSLPGEISVRTGKDVNRISRASAAFQAPRINHSTGQSEISPAQIKSNSPKVVEKA
jgi:hypothetical protein